MSRWTIRVWGALTRILFEVGRRLPSRAPSEGEARLIAQLRNEIASGPQEKPGQLPATDTWEARRIDFRDAVGSRDPRFFLQWPETRAALFVGFAPWTLHQLASLRADGSWRTRWRPALKESPAGRPQRLANAPYTSANLISKVYELYSFERLSRKALHGFKSVIELGAGYGLLVPTLSRLGFTGSYLAWDLPEFLSLQRFYARSLAEPIELSPDYASGLDGLRAASGALLEPVLLIATWSLSEMPLDLRARIEAALPPLDACLIAYQDEFRGIDNRSYFGKWSESRSDFEWTEEVIPETTTNRLLVGRRRQ